MMKKLTTMNFRLNILKGLGILIVTVMVKVASGQQDPMYTQYMFNTQTFNPAYTGTWETLGFMALARQQWLGMEGAPRTYTFSMQSIMKNPKVALGLNVISDKLGLEKRLGIFGDYSYLVRVGEKTNLRLGLKAGFTNYSNNLQEYTLFPVNTSDPMFQGEIETRFMPNFGIGAFLYKTDYYVGFSIPKLIQNRFTNNYNNYSVEAEMRHFFLNAGAVFTLSDALKFKPTFLTKATLGAPVEFDFSANFLLKEKLWLGAMYRTGDSYGFIAQWIFDRKLRVGYAVDFTTTKLRQFHNGTHEIMVSYELRFTKETIVSPRYF
jgi:type IX secretion system PorP/SprF family membrane protein